MAQGLARVEGVVVDRITGRPLEAVQVVLLPARRSALTDLDGSFALDRVPPGSYTARLVRLGYAPRDTAITVECCRLSLEVELEPRAEELGGLTVIGRGEGALSRFPGASAQLDETRLDTSLPLSGNEVLRTVPGVHIQEEEGLGLRANLGIRGLDPDRSRTVLLLEDGLPVALAPYGEPEMYYTPPIDRMTRVEVIKGSGSILFGPQTIGGVVNYVTPDPPLQPSGRITALGGSGGFAMGRLRYGGTWDGAGLAGTALYRRGDDLRGLGFHQADVTGKLAFRPGARDAFGVKVGFYDEASSATYVGLTDSILRADPDYVPAPDDRLRIRRYSVSVSHQRELGSSRSLRTALYAYQTSRDWQRQDYGYTASGSGFQFLNSTGNRNRSFEVIGLEPRYRAAFGRADLEAGVRGHYERARDQHINGATASSHTGEIRDDEIRHGYAVAGFAQMRFLLSDRLRVTPGIRLEYFRYDRHILRTRVRREITNPDGSTSVVRRPEDVDLRSGNDLLQVIPGLGLSWYGGERVEFFAGAHRGFSPPRIKDALIYDDIALPPGQQPGDPISLELDAELSWNLELGMRARPATGLRFEATGFWLDFSNQIVEPSASAGSAAQAALANQGATRHRGLETAALVDWGAIAGFPLRLETGIAYTFTDAAFANDRFLVRASGDTVNIRGNRLPYAPRHLLSGSLEISRDERFALRVDVLRVDEHFADNFETVASSANGRTGLIPSYAVASLSGWWAVPGAKLRVLGAVKNVFDNTYIASRRPEGVKPGLPRLVQLGVELAF
jgi:Fe(3+) dicitrate transport protein